MSSVSSVFKYPHWQLDTEYADDTDKDEDQDQDQDESWEMHGTFCDQQFQDGPALEATLFMPHAVLSETFRVSRVPSGHGFLAVSNDPQPHGRRLTKGLNVHRARYNSALKG